MLRAELERIWQDQGIRSAIKTVGWQVWNEDSYGYHVVGTSLWSTMSPHKASVAMQARTARRRKRLLTA